MGQGPLSGLRIVEFAGMGPGPFCGMLLSDLGADVIRVDRKGDPRASAADITSRGRRSLALDLKHPAAVETCLRLLEKADGLIEGFRPGVMERLGLGPEVVLKRSPRLAYGRMTGWGQTGPFAQTAGHDMNYIAISGALHAIGPPEKPAPPLNLVGDLGGGALYLAFGLLAAILSARQTGQGQVVDCAMSDGAASLMAIIYGLMARGLWDDSQRHANRLDGAAHYYDTYACADGKWLSIAAIEPQFYALLLEKAGVTDPDFENQRDPAAWPRLKAKLAPVIAAKTQAEWCALFAGSDACVAPVLTMSEAIRHPHNVARGTFVEIDGVVQPAPQPQFSATPGKVQRGVPVIGADGREILSEWGFTPTEVESVAASGALG